MQFRCFPILLAGALCVSACSNDLPDVKPAKDVVWLEQNWTPDQRQWFHHADQGTQTFVVPFEWFMALEQPGLHLFGNPGLLSDTDYLAKLGFIPGEPGPHNPAGLPVGFAVGDSYPGGRYKSVGLTCAACHTGHMTYKGTSIRYDGGPAMISANKIMSALFLSMFETQYNRRQFNRFAERLLGDDSTAEQRKALKKEFSETFMTLIKQVFAAVKTQNQKIIMDDIRQNRDSEILRNLAENIKKNLEQTEGYARTDALSRIGNQVFALDVNRPENFVIPNAPVSFPFIWSSSWFVWVQYDGSIMQPLVRNTGEALGVAALLTLDAGSPDNFASSANIKNLLSIEQLLRGSGSAFKAGQFPGLKAPKWPERILGGVDRAKAAHGETLYRQYCQQCHLPPVGSPDFWSEKYWSVTNLKGERLLNVPLIPVDQIGTDPNQSKILAERKVDTTGMGIDTEVFTGAQCTPTRITDGKAESYAFSLGAVVQQVIDHWYRENNIPPGDQPAMNGEMINCLQAPGAYKARPLNGIWATAPYLHNGSVPNLHALLSPAAERPATFYVGNLEFDPVNVGYQSGKAKGLFLLDTSKNGNSNRGHEFSDTQGKGVIGPLLSDEERFALIEYLKTL